MGNINTDKSTRELIEENSQVGSNPSTTAPKPTINSILEDQNKKRVEAAGRLQEAQKNNLSALQTIVNDSLKRREKLAEKKERNARSQAIANALGSLVNVFTAKAIADKGGYSPIISEYDKTAENVLRKSIEDRYALGNENENLLMKLEAERIGQENEFAKQVYGQEVAYIDAVTKAQLAPLETAAALDLYKAKADIMTNAKNDQRTHAGEVQKDVNADKPNANGGNNKKGGEPKPFKYDKAKIEQFVAEATTWDYEEDHPIIKGKKVKKTHTSKRNSAESAVAEQVAQYCQENEVSDNVTSVLSEVYRKLFQTIKPEVTKKFGNDLTKSIISAIKAGRNADEAYNVAKTYIEENR